MNTLLFTRFSAIRQEIQKVVIGQDPLIDTALVALFSGGHIILEGVPGLGKTLLARALAASLNLRFKRVQFTPDLMPSDLVGTNVFQPDIHAFKFLPGPLFSDILLADEINRTPPKTQSALLEAMEENQITVDGTSHPLPPHFFVIATQNPLEYEGTFPLPEAQTDRFLFKLQVDYPQPENELKLLQQVRKSGFQESILQTQASAEDLEMIRKEIENIHVSPEVATYLFNIVHASRRHPQVALGASPRAARAWLRASRTRAGVNQRDFVTPDDIKALAHPVLRHRLLRTAEAEIEVISVETLINQILARVEVPR